MCVEQQRCLDPYLSPVGTVCSLRDAQNQPGTCRLYGTQKDLVRACFSYTHPAPTELKTGFLLTF